MTKAHAEAHEIIAMIHILKHRARKKKHVIDQTSPETKKKQSVEAHMHEVNHISQQCANSQANSSPLTTSGRNKSFSNQTNNHHPIVNISIINI